MSGSNTLLEYKAMVANYLRDTEMERARGDTVRLNQIDNMSDDDLLRKWAWLGSIVGGIVFFVALPFALMILDRLIPLIILELIHFLLKMGMGLVIILFGFAVYFTVRKS